MKSSKSVNSLLLTNGGQQQQAGQVASATLRRPQPTDSQGRLSQNGQGQDNSAPTSPICRCRVMYLGSAVPHITKDGLQGIQEPLRELYPDQRSMSANAGIDSWLSVWSNGILIENVDETGREVKRFFKIDALHYCAAVKYVPQAADKLHQANSSATLPPNANSTSNDNLPKFLPLDSPHARLQQANSNPPIFASILRRTTGVKVLECHAFICKREAAANALVRCCFHAYADTMYAKQIGADVESVSSSRENDRPLSQAKTLRRPRASNVGGDDSSAPHARRSKSIAALNEDASGDYSDHSNNNYGIQNSNYPNSIMRRKSMNESQDNGDTSDSCQQTAVQSNNTNLRKHYKLSKSMYQLDQVDQPHQLSHQDYASQMGSHSNSIHNLASSKARWGHPMEQQAGEQQPAFYNPYASRVPSYPPQNLIDQQQDQHHQQQKQINSGGTLRSIRSVAANSIASTLLRSKKHAKAMSAAHVNNNQQQHQQSLPPITGFHQPHLNGSATLAPSQSFMMPPVPPMFLPRLPIMNGSQTMKLPRQQPSLTPGCHPCMEAMTPKEMKRLLKKSAKYGLDASKLIGPENGLPPMMPFRPLGPVQMAQLNANKSGTMNSQSIYSIDQWAPDVPDIAHLQGTYQDAASADPNNINSPTTIKSILVKPNPEFLKSKAGKKWLKQQKEFKKLLPPHLDGLPIIFGPPPIDALEPAPMPGHVVAGDQPGSSLPPLPNTFASHSGLPMMDSNGYYSQAPPGAQQPMYLLPSGRASTASTLLRYSPHPIQQQQAATIDPQNSYAQRGHHGMYGNSMIMPTIPPPPPPLNMMPLSNNQRGGDHYVPTINGADIYNPRVAGPIEHNSTQYIFSGQEQIAHQGQTRRRRHMVEQSVISLGDENEGEDDDDDDDSPGGAQNSRCRDSVGYLASVGDNDNRDNHMNGYYHQTTESATSSHQRREQQQRQLYGDDQQTNYEPVMTSAQNQGGSNDDQSSYSSGIYRRGHLNERAFSYSIRQEHKSGADACEYSNSNQDYGDRINYNSNHARHQEEQHQHSVVYDKPQQQHSLYNNVTRDGGQLQYDSNNNGGSRHIDELSNRLETQLKMRSFANSSSSAHVRSHM